jgi:hypothetical protein
MAAMSGNSGNWTPIFLLYPPTWAMFVAYVVIEYAFRWWAARAYPPAPVATTTRVHSTVHVKSAATGSAVPSSATLRSVTTPTDDRCHITNCPRYDRTFARQRMLDKRRDVCGRWWPSWIHAFVCTVGCVLFYFELVPFMPVAAHTVAYFLADVVVDRDPEYVVHHLAPIVCAEALLRVTPVPCYGIYAIGVVEAGNVVQHTASLLTARSGSAFHATVKWVLWTSRPLSWYPAFMVWYRDVPVELRWSVAGLCVLCAVLAIYKINIGWQLDVLKPRKSKPAPLGHVHVDESVSSNGSNGSNGSNISTSPTAELVSPRVQAAKAG